MTNKEAQSLLQEIRHYLVVGNPVWNKDEVAEALSMAIEALQEPSLEATCKKCTDLISRQAAIEAIAKFVPYAICDESTESYTNGLKDAYNLICQLPSADRPKGEWIWSLKDTDGTVRGCCSNCSFRHVFVGGHTAQYNFCPNCGADMRGESNV